MVRSCAWRTMLRTPGCNPCWRYAELFCGHAGVCGDGAGGFAGQFQPAFCADAIGVATGPALRPLVCLYESPAQSSQNFILGRQRAVVLRQAAGAKSFQLGCGGSGLYHAARGGIDRALVRSGGAPESRVVSALTRRENNFEKSVAAVKPFSRATVFQGDDAQPRHATGNYFAGTGARPLIGLIPT